MTQDQLSKERALFIEKRQKALRRKLSIIEKRVYSAVFDKVVAKLKLEDGRVKKGSDNLSLATKVDKIVGEITRGELAKISGQFSSDLNAVVSQNATYFKAVSNKPIEAINKVRDSAQKALSKSLESSNYLDRLISDKDFKSAIKKTLLKGISGNVPIKRLKDDMKLVIQGGPELDGKLTRYFEQNVIDTYNKYDRQLQTQFAVKLNLRAFIFSGGTIKTTRCFCRKNNGKVILIEEAKEWVSILNEECGPIWSKNDLSGYDPLSDIGGHKCRHSANFISDKEAIRRRPELKAILGEG